MTAEVRGGFEMSNAVTPVPTQDAAEPLVLAIDVGSTATRAGVYDAHARPVKGRRARVAHQFTTASDGTSIIDAEAVTTEVASLLN
jgi:gluconokinase